MKKFCLLFFVIALAGCVKPKQAPLENDALPTTAFNRLSEAFLADAKKGKDTYGYQQELAETTVNGLALALKTDAQRYAFWINVYNAYILDVLRKHPEYYEDRDNFFSDKQLTIAGEKIAFAKIEHGILRKSQWELGFGYMGKWFPGSFERKLRIKKRDYRIHFALNCGAKDCPPVAIYNPTNLHEQLEEGTRQFLKKSSRYDALENKVSITALFNWFRGDFGGKKGVKGILKKYGVVENTKGLSLEYTSYDWTLDLENFIDL